MILFQYHLLAVDYIHARHGGGAKPAAVEVVDTVRRRPFGSGTDDLIQTRAVVESHSDDLVARHGVKALGACDRSHAVARAERSGKQIFTACGDKYGLLAEQIAVLILVDHGDLEKGSPVNSWKR